MTDVASDNIQATLNFEDGKTASGYVANITNRGFVVVCQVLRQSSSALGQRVTLQLSGAQFSEPQTAPAHIQGVRTEDSDHHRVVVWVDDLADLERLMSSGISATFNRRGAYRVDPAPDEPVAIKLVLADGSWSHEDHASNVSATGLALMVDEGVVEHLREAEDLTVSVRLPKSSLTMNFVGHVKRIIPKEDGVLVGLDFDPDFTAHYDTMSNRIIDYIMRRQRALLREDRTR